MSLSPFGFEETKKFFGATNHMVQLSIKMKSENGVLPETPLLSMGKRVNQLDKDFIVNFFENDEVVNVQAKRIVCL